MNLQDSSNFNEFVFDVLKVVVHLSWMKEWLKNIRETALKKGNGASLLCSDGRFLLKFIRNLYFTSFESTTWKYEKHRELYATNVIDFFHLNMLVLPKNISLSLDNKRRRSEEQCKKLYRKFQNINNSPQKVWLFLYTQLPKTIHVIELFNSNEQLKFFVNHELTYFYGLIQGMPTLIDIDNCFKSIRKVANKSHPSQNFTMTYDKLHQYLNKIFAHIRYNGTFLFESTRTSYRRNGIILQCYLNSFKLLTYQIAIDGFIIFEDVSLEVVVRIYLIMNFLHPNFKLHNSTEMLHYLLMKIGKFDVDTYQKNKRKKISHFVDKIDSLASIALHF
uniref:Uncharacterized protein n=1 Tax=Strongyloides venezuelensis TaxID=75913 RepID=A0A0K0FRS9_STRVS